MARLGIIIMLCAALLLAGCTANATVPVKATSGYLADYSKLEPVQDKDGDEIRRWISPKLKPGQYSQLLLEPVVYHPGSQASAQVSTDTVQQIRTYSDATLRRELGKSFQLTNKAGPGVARIRVAFTGVTTDAAESKLAEYLSFVAIAIGISSAEAAAGRQVFILIEAEVSDSVTNERLGVTMRKTAGKQLLKDNKEQLTLDIARPIIDEKVVTARRIFDQVFKESK